MDYLGVGKSQNITLGAHGFNHYKNWIQSPSVVSYVGLLCFAPLLLYIVRTFSIRQLYKGYHRLGGSGRSNLSDEFDPKYVNVAPATESSTAGSKWRIKSIWVYPIKSCRGVELQKAQMSITGLQYDRQFMIAEAYQERSESGEIIQDSDGPSWRFMTQRTYPKMSQIRTEIWLPDNKSISKDTGGLLVIKYPILVPSLARRLFSTLTGLRPEHSFSVPLAPSASLISKNAYPLVKTRIWYDSPRGYDMSIHLPSDFAQFFAPTSSSPKKIALLRVAPGLEREVFRAAPRKEVLGRQPLTGFADANPCNMQNLASVRAVEARQPAGSPRLTVLRFRPNIVMTGPVAFEEDYFKRIRIGEMEFIVYSRCTRCRLPNIDPDTGERHKAEPNATLRSFRAIDKGATPEPCLGMDMVAAKPEGQITVGDQVEVLETGDHFYIRQKP